MRLRRSLVYVGLAFAILSISVPAMAGDLLLSRTDVNDLTRSNIGKPFWSLQAQCAGAFGAAYAFEQGHGKAKRAEEDKATGVSMLDDSLARLQIDRGLDRAQALDVALPEVEFGRQTGKAMLDKQGDASDSSWNWLRSVCLDVASAAHNHLGS